MRRIFIIKTKVRRRSDILLAGAFKNESVHVSFMHITKTRLFKCTENFTTRKRNFSEKKTDSFSYFRSKHRLWVFVRTASAQNIDCGYSLEPPRRGGSNEYPQSMF